MRTCVLNLTPVSLYVVGVAPFSIREELQRVNRWSLHGRFLCINIRSAFVSPLFYNLEVLSQFSKAAAGYQFVNYWFPALLALCFSGRSLSLIEWFYVLLVFSPVDQLFTPTWYCKMRRRSARLWRSELIIL